MNLRHARAALAALAVSAAALSTTSPALADGETVEQVGPTEWFIYNPDVTHRYWQYPDIQFRPGDWVQVEAGGCVQTGGHGQTWKRFVNPEGANSDRLYHGEFFIPGAMGVFQTFQGYQNTSSYLPYSGNGGYFHVPTIVPGGVDPDHMYLQLGYADDAFQDNGYWGRDNGNNNQCAPWSIGPTNNGQAWVRIHIWR